MKILGNHYLIDFYNCDVEKLKSVNEIRKVMIEASEIGNLHIVEECFHQFHPTGVSGVLVLEESHFTIHTWPEYQYASIDLYLCDLSIDVLVIIDYLKQKFRTKKFNFKQMDRGLE